LSLSTSVRHNNKTSQQAMCLNSRRLFPQSNPQQQALQVQHQHQTTSPSLQPTTSKWRSKPSRPRSISLMFSIIKRPAKSITNRRHQQTGKLRANSNNRLKGLKELIQTEATLQSVKTQVAAMETRIWKRCSATW